MWITAAAFAALVVLPLACYGIDFSEGEKNFQITIYCGNTPVTVQDPGFSKVKSQDELGDLVEKKLREAFLSPKCQQLIKEAEVGEGACPISGDASTTSSTVQPTTSTAEPTPSSTTTTTKSSGTTATTGSTTNPMTTSESTKTTHSTAPPATTSPALQGTTATTGSTKKPMTTSESTTKTTHGTAPTATSSPASQGPIRYSFRSYAEPNHYIGLDTYPTLVDKETFYKIIRPGLQGTAGTISFEGEDGLYLKHKARLIRNGQIDDPKNATFWPKSNHFFKGYYAYESFDLPNYFIRYDEGQNRLELDKEPFDDQSKKYASFLQLPKNITSLLNITCNEGQNGSYTLGDVHANQTPAGVPAFSSLSRKFHDFWLNGSFPCLVEITKINVLIDSTRGFAVFKIPENSSQPLLGSDLLAWRTSAKSNNGSDELPALATKIAITLKEQDNCKIEVFGRMNDACSKKDPKHDTEITGQTTLK